MTTGAGPAPGLLISYLKLRWVLGALAVALPFLLMAWGFYINGWWKIQGSLSAYYELRTRDLFVGFLFAIAWFLIKYRGHDREEKLETRTLFLNPGRYPWRYPLSDNWAGYVAGVGAMGVAFFPTKGGPLEAAIHHVSSFGMILALSYFCLVLFRKTGEEPPTHEKLRRNTVYKWNGPNARASSPDPGRPTLMTSAP